MTYRTWSGNSETDYMIYRTFPGLVIVEQTIYLDSTKS